MEKYFGLKNYKSFSEKQEIKLRPITILVGKNNSGKSSILEAMSLLSGFFSLNNESTGNFSLLDVGKLNKRAGEYSNLLNKNSKNREISFYLPFELVGIREELELKITFGPENKTLINGIFSKMQVCQKKTGHSLLSFEWQSESSVKVTANLLLLWEAYRNEIDIVRNIREGNYEDDEPESFFDQFDYDCITDILEVEKEIEYNRSRDTEFKSNEEIFYDIMLYKNSKLGNQSFSIENWSKMLGANEQVFKNFSFEFEKYLPDNEIHLGHETLEKRYDLKKITVDDDAWLTQMTPRFDFFRDKTHFQYLFNSVLKGLSERMPPKYPFSFFTKDRFGSDTEAFKIDEYKLPKDIFKLFKEYDLASNLHTLIFFQIFIGKNFVRAYDKMKRDIKTERMHDAPETIQKRGNSINDNDEMSVLIKELLANDTKYQSFIDKYLKEFEIGDSMYLRHDSVTSTYSISIINGRFSIPLADSGTGVSKILLILLRISLMINKIMRDPNYQRCTLIIEEPESNLHPALQSKLADLFHEASSKYGIRFIVESHSEYLIRKLQYLTADPNSEMKPEDSIIYYVNDPDKKNDEERIREIAITKDGLLTKEFGAGFFDEADRIAFDLFFLRENQKN